MTEGGAWLEEVGPWWGYVIAGSLVPWPLPVILHCFMAAGLGTFAVPCVPTVTMFKPQAHSNGDQSL